LVRRATRRAAIEEAGARVQHWIPPRPDGGDDEEWLRHLPPMPPAPPPRPVHPPRRVTAIVSLVLAVGLVVSAVVAGAPPRRPTPQQQTGPRYTFIETTGTGDPVRWNPCQPIHYVVNDELADYSTAIADVQEAAQRVEDATGIDFVYDGQTDEAASQGRAPYQPDRYGEGWAPVLVAWTAPDTSPIEFSRGNDVALGVASPEFPPHGRSDIYVSGWVAVNADYPGPGGFGIPSSVGLTVQHELGHVVGMGHTKVFGELMQTSGGGALDWGEGDLEGLALLGRDAGCLVTPEPGQR
jgi:hypothetical protein